MNRIVLAIVGALITPATLRAADAPPSVDAAHAKPNVVFILADDLGYGDVHCLNPSRGKIATPNIDRLATQGMTFTDAHGSSAVCTPTRYGILTGRYNWRSTLSQGVLSAYAPPLIASGRLTVPALLKQQGYDTAAIGKWHLGWTWPENRDFTQAITDGPTARGFDYYFGTDIPNNPPYCFIENDHTVGIPTVPLPKNLLINHLASKPGPALPGWKLEAILPTLTDKACDYIAARAKTGKPFFLYMPLTSPHTPIAPTEEWQGKSGLGRYGDFVMETDAIIGRVIEAVDKSGVAGNTLIIITSDNGCSPAAGIPALEARGHFPSGEFRGYKTDAWDGGHHIPFIARWPGTVKPGTKTDQMICLNDLMATAAEILGAKVPDTAGEDSVSFLPLLRGSDQPTRQFLVHHSYTGQFAVRDGKWKLLLCPGSGGWGKPTDPVAQKKGAPPVQLYDLTTDIGEKKNLQAEHPEIVARLTKLLDQYIADGRTTPGTPQKNDRAVAIHAAASSDEKTEVDDK